jgi:hypothetical protein
LEPEQETKLRRFLNLHYLGDEEVNFLTEDGILIPKHSEKESKEYSDAIGAALSFHEIDIKITFDVTGIPTAKIIHHEASSTIRPSDDSREEGMFVF